MNEGRPENIHSTVGRTIERVARESYGRLVAYLSVHTHDLASAEIALSEALVAALKTLPRDGVPQNPEAWLLIAARRSLVDVVRHRQVVLESEPILQFLRESSTEAAVSTAFQDERLKLLFVRAHPAIDAAMPPLDAADGVGTGCSTYRPSLSPRAQDNGAVPVLGEDKNPQWWHPV